LQDKASRESVPSLSGPDDKIILPDQEYVIGPSDVVEVSVLKMPELTREYRVSAEGTIEIPFLGQIEAEKKTTRELAAAIAKELQGGYLVDPQVSVVVKQVNRRYFVLGAVRTPGVYNIEGRPTLLELITIAGGLNPTYGSTAFIMHKTQPAEKDAEAAYDMKKANLNALLRGDFSENVRIEPGDIVQIPPSDVFFVAGEVRAPGSFTLKEGTTLRQAISMAQNTNATAAPGKAVIFREDGSKEKKQIPIDITAVMRGRSPDVELMANDIIVVPNSKAKSAFVPILNSFGVNVAYGAARVIIP
jgi:polysaccharide export outer membrane protein